MVRKISVLLKDDAKDSYLLLKKAKDLFFKNILKSIDHKKYNKLHGYKM